MTRLLRLALGAFCAAAFLGGCAKMPVLKDGGVEIAKDTTASVEDLGAVRVTNQF